MNRHAAVVFGLLLAFACGGDDQPQTVVEAPTGPPGLPTPDQVVENGEHVITADGVRRALLTAEQMYFYNQIGKVVGDTLSINFYGPDGTFTSLLTARSGEMDQESGVMIARGDVFVRGRTATIRTEELTYDPNTDRIRSDHPTEIVQAGNVIRGQGIESNPALTDLTVRSGSAVLRSEPDVGPRPVVVDSVGVDPGIRADGIGQVTSPSAEDDGVAVEGPGEVEASAADEPGEGDDRGER